MKNILSFLIILSLFITITTSTFAASNITNDSLFTDDGDSLESIISSFQDQIDKINLNSNHSKKNQKLRDAMRNARDETLISAGYDIYRVNSDSFRQIETELNTNLEDIGLDSNSSYLIVIGGEPNDSTSSDISSESLEFTTLGAATSGPAFNYTYDGTTYVLRYLYVTADDDEADPRYAQASAASVLSSSSMTLINNCLNTAVSAYISTISAGLGTVASICGLQLFNFGSTQSSTLYLNGGTNWSRTYTQVYGFYDQSWKFCSSVEYVKTKSFMSGLYYNSSLNEMVSVPTNSSSATTYSSYYYNYTWRKTQACIAFIYGSPCKYNKTGYVRYKYGSTYKITHYENF